MMLAMGCWALAMVGGLLWSRTRVAMLIILTMGACVVGQPRLFQYLDGWLWLAMLGGTPWLLSGRRAAYRARIRDAQASKLRQLTRLQEIARAVLELQAMNRRLESQITQITELYHVTKETARALHVEELLRFSLDVFPRLFTLRGVRLIERSVSPEGASRVFRARRREDGRLIQEPAASLVPFEEEILQKSALLGVTTFAQASDLVAALPEDVSRVAWAPLWSERQSIGALIIEELPREQVGTLSIIANQVSLQFSRVRLYQAVEAMAVTDPLTGLFVRRYFLEFAQDELMRSIRHDLPCTILLADLDHFKMKNDTYGHLVGDVVLREVARLMRDNLRGVDLIARYGGEEFVLLLIETSADQAMPIAERLRQVVEVQPIRAYDEVLSQTISLGMAAYPEDGVELPVLIERADQALYAAKRAGRNRVVRWSSHTSRAQTIDSPR